MKKIIFAILAVALLVALSVPAMAADLKISVTPSTDTVELKTDALPEITFTVSLSGDAAFSSLGFELDFDKEIFEYKQNSFKKLFTDGFSALDTDTSTYMLVISDGDAVPSNKALFQFTLTLKEGAAIGNTTVGGKPSCKNGNDSVEIGSASAKVSVVCGHDYGKWTAVEGKDEHESICSKCNKSKTEKHEWELEKDTSTGNCEEASQKDYKCKGCGATKVDKVAAQKHTFDNACDSTCNNADCKYERDTDHKFSKEYVTNEKKHWFECQTCHEKKDVYSHTPGAPATETTPQICIHCEYILAPAVHVHEISETWYSDAESHWHRCEASGCYFTQDKVKHDYDNDCDVDCNTCSAIRVPPHTYNPEWKGNSEGHWNNCSECGAKSEILPHEPGDEATMDTPQTCIDCNFWIKWPLSHEHTLSEQWQSDDIHHWQNCSECGEAAETQPHAWGEDVILQEATATEKGSALRTCVICGKQVTEEIPPTGGTTDSGDATAPGDSGALDKDTEEGRFPWEIAGVIAGILLIVGIVLLVIEYLRSRKTNMYGRFSK